MKKILLSLLLCSSVFATDKIVTEDPTKPGIFKINGPVVTNGVIVFPSNSISSTSISWVTNSIPVSALSTNGASEGNVLTITNGVPRFVAPTVPVSGVANGFGRWQVYNSSASWTNTFSVTNIWAELWGAGAGGHGSVSSNPGGGGGAYVGSIITVTNNQVVTFVVGTGGGNNANGGNTTLNALVAGGGQTGIADVGGAGGTATGGANDETSGGSPGTTDSVSGVGGMAAKGGGGGINSGGGTGGVGKAPGGGGGGGNTGGAGANGRVIIHY